MPDPLGQHQEEIQQNRLAWERKPLLREVYAGFYRRLLHLRRSDLPGRVVELGSGIGNLRDHCPGAICTDLFENPWLNMVCDGYELPFRSECVSHLILIDVFHHLERPAAFLHEAHRVLVPQGRLLLMDPFISTLSFPIYGLFHHEPVAWRNPINDSTTPPPRPRHYYAAQGNATRVFGRRPPPPWIRGWNVFYFEAFASFSYLASGGFRGPALGAAVGVPWLRRLDACLTRWPRVFGVRCVVGLERSLSNWSPEKDAPQD